MIVWMVTAAFGQSAPAANFVVGDFDRDGQDDIAIGIRGACGAIEIWLSSVDPRLGRPERVDPAVRTELAPGSVWVEPRNCDPYFGLDVVFERDALGTLLGEHGEPTTSIALARRGDGTWSATLVQVGGTPVHACEPCSGAPECCNPGCDPCSGPAPCCNLPPVIQGCIPTEPGNECA